MTGSDEYQQLLAAAAMHESVAAVVIGGGRAKGVVSDWSDWDVYVLLHDDAVPTSMSPVDDPLLDVFVSTISDFLGAMSWDEPLAWNRYTFAHIVPELDRTAGALTSALGELEQIPQDARSPFCASRLDAYVNSVYRSVENERDGNQLAGRLDRAEAVPAGLDLLFGLEGRIRPYNKFLLWELKRHPLDADRVVRRIVDDPTGCFSEVEAAARRAGLDDTLDAWGYDALRLLRSADCARRR